MCEENKPRDLVPQADAGRASAWADTAASNLLSAILGLTSDAVLVFDGRGRVVLANEEAERLFALTTTPLDTLDVRMLFAPVAALDNAAGNIESTLPFPTDGSSVLLNCSYGQRPSFPVRVRCGSLFTSPGSFVLVAHEIPDAWVDGAATTSDERLVDELSRANRRLSGTLEIVLGTLDSLDVGTLFSRILERVSATMDAWGSLMYLAEGGGYRLRGATESLAGAPVPPYVPASDPLAQLALSHGSTLRLHVRPLGRDDLRRSDAVPTREVREEGSGASVQVSARSLVPFASFLLVPVWFGGRLISFIVVGWRNAYRLRVDDARLLDAVAEYLSVQLAGAFAALAAQHTEHLETLATSLRERLTDADKLDFNAARGVFEEAAQGLDAVLVPLLGNPHQRTTVAELSDGGPVSVPLDVAQLLREKGPVCVERLDGREALMSWLEYHALPASGLLVALDAHDTALWGFLLLRNEETEAFSEEDVAFVRRLCEDAREVQAGERQRNLNKRIAEALQRGMRNELQSVDGLTAQSRYSSATEAAFVGGDFYDLIRLPEGRACVIMGDVSGKGVEAASVSSAVKTALGAYAWEGLQPARMVTLLNDFLLGFSRIETFATLFVGVVDLVHGRLVYCSAGHPPALLWRSATGELVTLQEQSGVVGAFEGMRYRDGETELRENDVLVLYTDGVTEARNPQGAFFGEDGLRDSVSEAAARGFEGLCDRLLGSVEAFAEGSLEDDVALVVVRYDRAP